MTSSAQAGIRRWLLPSLEGYRRNWIGKDVVAGLSAGAVVVPQAMAYATIADLPVQVGLYTCIVPMLVYALLGGSRAMSVSTTSTIATLTASTLVTAGVAASASDPDAALGSVVALTLLVGAILLLCRLLRLGGLVENISEATVLGIKIGVGATVAVGQLPKLLGVSVDTSGQSFIPAVATVIRALPDTQLPTLVLSIGSVLTLLLFGRFAPRVPATLIVVVGGILLVAFAHLDQLGVALIAPVPSGLPIPELPDLTHLAGLVPGALAIAIMAFLESAAVARGIRLPTDPTIDSDRELFATGAANVVGSFFTTMPAAGGFSQSAVNQRAGARSQLAAIVTVVLAIAVAVFLGPVVSLLPQATLAAMVFVAVTGLIAIPELVRWWSLSRLDFWIAFGVAILGLTAGLLVAVFGGVIVTLLLVLREVNTPTLDLGDRRGDAIAVHLGRGLYTANALANVRAIVELADEQHARAIVLDIERQHIMTVTVLDSLEDLDRELTGRGVALHFARTPEAAQHVLVKTAWYRDLEAAGRVHETVEDGLDAASRPAQ